MVNNMQSLNRSLVIELQSSNFFIQGHRSSILVSIESAYATSY